jgi:rifampicin phosphotransferase
VLGPQPDSLENQLAIFFRDGIRVPPGFCVTTEAFEQMMAAAPSLDDQLGRLSRVKSEDREAIRALSLGLRATIAPIAISDEVASAITRSLAQLGEQSACAVRSSATAEEGLGSTPPCLPRGTVV